MATKHRKAKSRPNRNPKAAATRSSRRALPAGTPAMANLDALEETIEDERTRLMIAHSLLNCAAIAMEAEDVCTGDSPHYPSIVELARDLINRSINRLDSVARNRAMGEGRNADDEEFEDGLDPALHGSYRVKEPGTVYLC